MSNNVSIDPAWWEMIMSDTSSWDVMTYERDWLNWMGEPANNLNDPVAYMREMADAAYRAWWTADPTRQAAQSPSDSGTESRPDSGVDSGTDSGTDSGVSERRIFVTNTIRNADLGGIAGADELCAVQAADANLEGDFKAWLSTRLSPVSDRLTRASGPYVLVDGTMVANDWDDLVDGSILAPINLDANGEVRTGDVWTGTLATGASYPDDDCAAFTSGSDGVALCGDSASMTATWTENITPSCSVQLRLYCIEQ